MNGSIRSTANVILVGETVGQWKAMIMNGWMNIERIDPVECQRYFGRWKSGPVYIEGDDNEWVDEYGMDRSGRLSMSIWSLKQWATAAVLIPRGR